MSLSQIILIVGGIAFLYFLSRKPEMVAILLFTAVIADINFDLAGMPLNFRAMVSLSLLGRVLLGGDSKPIPAFAELSYTWQIIFFSIFVLAVTSMHGLLDMGVFKEFMLSVVCAFLAYHYFFQHKNYKIFKISIILAGLSCMLDLAYTYGTQGGFPVNRLYYQFTPAYVVVNHNFFGYICGTAFVFLLADYLADSKLPQKINLIMMPAMFLGVLLSTSRSALLILLIVSLGVIGKALFTSGKGKKATTLIIVSLTCVLLMLFLFQIITIMFQIDSEFMETITARMIDEPMAILNRWMGNSYDVNSLDSMDWRAEASALAYNTFMNMPVEDQLFGIGWGGFLARDIGHGYDAHNGILLMFIEIGVVGSVIYFWMLISLVGRTIRYGYFSPLTVCLIYMFMYVTSHNKELMSFFAFLVTGTLAAELKRISMPEEEDEEDEEDFEGVTEPAT